MEPFHSFREVKMTGVTWATKMAKEHGFHQTHPDWANFGQGAPETGPLPNAPKRNENLFLDDEHEEYAPVAGNRELCEKIATYYNEMYRTDKSSKYTWKNVCVVPGGRAGITRIMASLTEGEIGYTVPDYTAYEECLGLFSRLSPTLMLNDFSKQPFMPAKKFNEEVEGRGLNAVLLSNPCNPTGQLLRDEELASYVKTGRDHSCCMIMDEFYSHFYYAGEPGETVSAAKYVDNVNTDPVLLINGLTKSWRCPGWRVCWVVGPEKMVDIMTASGSFLEGGANNPLQKQALPLMEMDFIREDILALQAHFKMKRDWMVNALKEINIKLPYIPQATFYLWADIGELPEPLNNCHVFLEEAVKERVIVVPGTSFDINPRKRRFEERGEKFHNFVRIAFGMPLAKLQLGVEGFKRMIAKFS
jgi:aspartate/methionine/tyrosine aminotransferase